MMAALDGLRGSHVFLLSLALSVVLAACLYGMQMMKVDPTSSLGAPRDTENIKVNLRQSLSELLPQEELRQLKFALEATRGELAQLRKQLNTSKQEFAPQAMQSEIATLRKQLSESKQEFAPEAMQSELANLRKQLDEWTKKGTALEATQSELATLRKQLNEPKQEIPSCPPPPLPSPPPPCQEQINKPVVERHSRKCAADITTDRFVLFLPEDMKDRIAVSGEYTLMYSAAQAVRANGFEVISHPKMDAEFLRLAKQAHRIFTFDDNFLDCGILKDPSIRCKINVLFSWGEHTTTRVHDGRYSRPGRLCGIQAKQVFTMWPDRDDNFIGVWPMHALRHPAKTKERKKVGFLMGKQAGYFNSDNIDASKAIAKAIRALIDDGFQLYSTCQDGCNFPPEVQKVGRKTPEEFAAFLAECAFVMGVGDPIDSPSPMEAISQGAAFLNPGKHFGYRGGWQDPNGRWEHQHGDLAPLGAPYVYTIDLSNSSDVLAAARSAARYRFLSYTPWQMTRDVTVDRMCSTILEDTQTCQCAQAESEGASDVDRICNTRLPIVHYMNEGRTTEATLQSVPTNIGPFSLR